MTAKWYPVLKRAGVPVGMGTPYRTIAAAQIVFEFLRSPALLAGGFTMDSFEPRLLTERQVAEMWAQKGDQ